MPYRPSPSCARPNPTVAIPQPVSHSTPQSTLYSMPWSTSHSMLHITFHALVHSLQLNHASVHVTLHASVHFMTETVMTWGKTVGVSSLSHAWEAGLLGRQGRGALIIHHCPSCGSSPCSAPTAAPSGGAPVCAPNEKLRQCTKTHRNCKPRTAAGAQCMGPCDPHSPMRTPIPHITLPRDPNLASNLYLSGLQSRITCDSLILQFLQHANCHLSDTLRFCTHSWTFLHLLPASVTVYHRFLNTRPSS